MTRLYLVDDHQIVRAGLCLLLETWGYQVVGQSADLTEALAEIQDLQPDVLLLDLQLGGRSGLELLGDIQRRNLRTRCIVLTMLAQPNLVAQALKLGAMGYVLKGSAGDVLEVAIETVAGGQRYLGPEVAELAVQSLTQQEPQIKIAALSPRERQITAMVAQGLSSTQIGEILHLSPKTVATYRSRLMAKLSVKDVPGLVRFAMHHRLIEDVFA